ncbi:thioesterase domain-containing protein [Polymorphospora sp. NPDC050346]|uniref:thioesterase II family protein n=1 Tax=Polymorphospora sp. NPDC050346 TaxID=3155780 RepID=UPI003400FA0A
MRAATAGDTTWLRRYRPVPHAETRLVCLPHAGGGASSFRRWPARLPAHLELHAVQYPGREDRLTDSCVTDFARLADLVTDALTPLLDRPLALFGHSMGAALGHEVAVRLARRGCTPAHLFVSGLPAPCHHRPGTVHLGDDEALVAELRRLGGTDDRALDDPELRAVVLPSVRADYRAFETHRPVLVPPLGCPVTGLVGVADPTASPAEVRDWAHHTRAAFALRTYPGAHFYLDDVHETVVADVVAALGPARRVNDLP